jgi:hypothetical protein
MPDPALATTLKGLLAFRNLSESDLQKIVEAGEVLTLPSGEEFNVGGAKDAPWYLLVQGRARIFEIQPGQPRQDPGRLIRPGSFFGADYLLYDRMARWRASALTECQLLMIPSAQVALLITQIPVLKQGLLDELHFEKMERTRNFRWLDEDEMVKLVIRQHPMFLLIALVNPLLMTLGGVLIMLFGASMPIASFGWAFIWIGALVLAVAVLWLAWQVIDWLNDHYVVTDKRVVWLERLLFLYDSRREALLSAIKTSEVKKTYWGKVFGFGDLIVFALMGQVKFANISQPEKVKALVDELQRATAVSEQRQEVSNMERLIQLKINPPPPAPPAPAPPETPKPQTSRRAFNLVPPEKFFRFALREEKDKMITYRQHTVILIARIWLPTLLEISLAGGALYLIVQNLAGRMTFPSIIATVLTWFLLAFMTSLWWLYQYMDWRDDLYQIAPDKLISSNRRPLGEETVMTANIGNILSMDYQRVGIIGLLFNFGNLEINTGSESKLVFQNILDPSQAQTEISNYLFEMRRKQRMAEQSKEMERYSNWMAAYYRVVDEDQGGKTQKEE